MNVRSGRLPLFDSLRAIGALSLLAFHTGPSAGLNTGDHFLTPYVSRLEMGVWIFFVISGCLLYRPFVRARLKGRPMPHTGAYAWRRFLRIVPAYWVALALVSVWFARPDVFTATGIPTYFGFAQIYSEKTAVFGQGLGQAWSLCVEMSFYIFLPFFALAMRALPGKTRETRLRWEIGALLGLLAGSLLWKAAVLARSDEHFVLYHTALYALPAYMDLFVLGMGLAVLSVWMEDRERLPAILRPLDRFPSLAWIVAGLAFLLVSTKIGIHGFQAMERREYLVRNVLYAVVAVALILPAIVGDQTRGVLRRILANRVLLFLGVVSYGVFLYQTAVIVQLVKWGFGEPGTPLRYAQWLVATTAITVALATLSYYIVERPALSLKRLVSPAEEPARQPLAPDVAGELTAVSATAGSQTRS